MPDSVFIEDAAIVFDKLAIVARPGAPSRRAETIVARRWSISIAALHRAARLGRRW